MTKNNNEKGSCPTLNTKKQDNDSNNLGISTWITYSAVSVLILSYCVFLYDRNIFKEKSHVPGITHLETLFDAIEKYSPFHEFLLDDNYYYAEERIKVENDNDITRLSRLFLLSYWFQEGPKYDRLDARFFAANAKFGWLLSMLVVWMMVRI